MRSLPRVCRRLPTWLFAILAAGFGDYCNQICWAANAPGADQVPHPATASAAAASGTSSPLRWTLPAGWKEMPAGQMRVASFLVEGKKGEAADVSVVPLPGLAGGDLENVNRWRSQVGKPALKAAELEKAGEEVEVGGQSARLFDQAGGSFDSDAKTRILAAVVHRDGVAWFFKITGEDKLVAAQKPAFVNFLKSVRFTGASGGSQLSDATQLPPGHPSIMGLSASAASTPVSESVKPVWQAPASWQEVAAGSFLIAKFQINGGADSQATVNVSLSAGDGGGSLANVNRWRGQLGLKASGEAELMKEVRSFEVAGGKVMFVDMSGIDARTQQKARLLGAIVSQPNRTWFYKLMGNDKLVERESEAFAKFVKNVKYPNAQ